MARRTQEDTAKTRKRILESALMLFLEKGYEKTSFNEIAAKVEMTKGAVYWHFATKQELLITIVQNATSHFRSQIASLLPEERLSYKAVTDVMIEYSRRIFTNPEDRRFFRFLSTQIRWGDKSMMSVRKALLSDDSAGPTSAVRHAIREGIKAGTVRGDVDANLVADITMAVWTGILQAQIEQFITSEWEEAMRHGFDAIWESIAVGGLPRRTSAARNDEMPAAGDVRNDEMPAVGGLPRRTSAVRNDGATEISKKSKKGAMKK